MKINSFDTIQMMLNAVLKSNQNEIQYDRSLQLYTPAVGDFK